MKQFRSAISSYHIFDYELEIVSACIASAGTTHLDVFKPANNDWVINTSNVSSALNDDSVNWINDFSAQALATTTLNDNDVIVINQGSCSARKSPVGYWSWDGFRDLRTD